MSRKAISASVVVACCLAVKSVSADPAISFEDFNHAAAAEAQSKKGWLEDVAITITPRAWWARFEPTAYTNDPAIAVNGEAHDFLVYGGSINIAPVDWGGVSFSASALFGEGEATYKYIDNFLPPEYAETTLERTDFEAGFGGPFDFNPNIGWFLGARYVSVILSSDTVLASGIRSEREIGNDILSAGGGLSLSTPLNDLGNHRLFGNVQLRAGTATDWYERKKTAASGAVVEHEKVSSNPIFVGSDLNFGYTYLMDAIALNARYRMSYSTYLGSSLGSNRSSRAQANFFHGPEVNVSYRFGGPSIEGEDITIDGDSVVTETASAFSSEFERLGISVTPRFWLSRLESSGFGRNPNGANERESYSLPLYGVSMTYGPEHWNGVSLTANGFYGEADTTFKSIDQSLFPSTIFPDNKLRRTIAELVVNVPWTESGKVSWFTGLRYDNTRFFSGTEVAPGVRADTDVGLDSFFAQFGVAAAETFDDEGRHRIFGNVAVLPGIGQSYEEYIGRSPTAVLFYEKVNSNYFTAGGDLNFGYAYASDWSTLSARYRVNYWTSLTNNMSSAREPFASTSFIHGPELNASFRF